MIVQPLPGGSLVLDPVAVEVVYMTMEAGRRQLRVDGLGMPAEVRFVLAQIEAQVKATRATAADRGRPVTADVVPSGLMTVADAAAQVGRPEKTVRTWAAAGRLPSAQRAGHVWLVALDEVQEAASG